MISISSRVKSVFSSSSSNTIVIDSIWLRLAISGTTPPNCSCIFICEFITFERTSLPFFTIEAEVSSQLDSIPKVIISFILFPS